MSIATVTTADELRGLVRRAERELVRAHAALEGALAHLSELEYATDRGHGVYVQISFLARELRQVLPGGNEPCDLEAALAGASQIRFLIELAEERGDALESREQHA
jgi:hypothetical protein